jgi:hypothetical protein
MLQQTPSGNESTRGLNQQQHCDYAEQRPQEKSRRIRRSQPLEVGEQSIRNHKKDHGTHRVECGERQPEQSEQPNMLLHASRARLRQRDWTDDLLAALAAKRLTRLHHCAASIAEHEFLRRRFANRECARKFLHQMIRRKIETVPYVRAHSAKCINEKATRQQGGLFFKGE